MAKAKKVLSKVLLVEKDVENHYRAEIEKVVPASFTSPYKSDGYIEWRNVRMLLESKLNGNLDTQAGQSNVLAQLLYYVKKFENDGLAKPNVLFVGDKFHCFALSTEKVEHFLSLPIDWSLAPSTPSKELTKAISDKGVSPVIHELADVDFSNLMAHCELLAGARVDKFRLTEKTLRMMFDSWCRNIVLPENKFDPVKMVDVFFAVVFHQEGEKVFLHPTKKNTLCFHNIRHGTLEAFEVKVNQSAMVDFFNVYERGYSPSEIDNFIAQRDRLIDEDKRRRTGAFYTPTIWAEEALKHITDALGENWKQECIVWDCCAGVANLTRDCGNDFSNLILSTLEEADVAAIKREGYNSNASIVQLDFLNTTIDLLGTLPEKVDEILRKGAEQGKRIVFFMNPPYATAGIKGEKSKDGVAMTLVNDAMKTVKIGACSQQLYAQFLFQCEEISAQYGYKQKTIGVFCKPAFMTSESFKGFRNYFFDKYAYQSGFLFQASHFADVSGAWGVSFTLWNDGKTDKTADMPIILKDMVGETIVSTGVKELYNSDGRQASSWVREPVKGLKTYDAPQMASGLKIRTKGTMRGRLVKGALFYATMKSNNLMSASDFTFLTASCSAQGSGGNSVTEGVSWRRTIAIYAARKLVNANWINDKDEYLIPNTSHPNYSQWVDDCHIYALLHTSNNMTSMRDVEYKDKKWTINNHFFWLSRAEALALYDTRESVALYRDCKASTHEPYFARVLPTLSLSPLAKEILSDLNALLKATLADRVGQEERLHLLTWDAGIYQLKNIWSADPRWKAIKEKHRKLATQLQEGVYTFGFLRK